MRHLVVLVVAGLASCHVVQAQTDVSRPPKLVFIAVDDLNNWVKYDHRSDPDEFDNLVHSDPEGAAPVTKRLQKWLPKIHVDPGPVP